MRKAVFPGTFDPFTIGHEAIVNRSMHLFDEIIIAVGVNANKQAMFSLDQRLAWINKIFEHNTKISIHEFTGLTVEYCKTVGANYILRGLRSSADFNYERAIAQMNKALVPDVETIFVMSLPEHSAISSTILRDIIRNQGNVDDFVPKQISVNL